MNSFFASNSASSAGPFSTGSETAMEHGAPAQCPVTTGVTKRTQAASGDDVDSSQPAAFDALGADGSQGVEVRLGLSHLAHSRAQTPYCWAEERATVVADRGPTRSD